MSKTAVIFRSTEADIVTVERIFLSRASEAVAHLGVTRVVG
jgi:hypothetical protein